MTRIFHYLVFVNGLVMGRKYCNTMQKIIFLSAALTAALMLASCGPKPAAGPRTVDGRVLDASMNTITLLTSAGDTLNISTMNADPTEVPGVLVDDSVKLTYADTVVNGNRVMLARALTVTVHSPYYYISGAWVEPNPIDSTVVQGIQLNPNGTASSIGMATLVFRGWNLLSAHTLLLTGESVGNGQTIPVADTLTVDKLNADSLVLSDGTGRVVWRLARRK